MTLAKVYQLLFQQGSSRATFHRNCILSPRTNAKLYEYSKTVSRTIFIFSKSLRRLLNSFALKMLQTTMTPAPVRNVVMFICISIRKLVLTWDISFEMNCLGFGLSTCFRFRTFYEATHVATLNQVLSSLNKSNNLCYS
jgi:hypothetical protein